ncbi:MAG: hypothetical protein ACUVWR_03145 [Anaerolineae bacterium]
MLNLYPQYVAWHYYLLVVVTVLGTVQAAASVASLRGLQIGGRLWPRRLAWGAFVVACVGGVVAFIRTSPDYISPGLAGTELIAMFVAGGATAVAISLLGGLFCPSPGCWQPGIPNVRPLLDSWECTLTYPDSEAEGLVVVIPDPDLSAEATLPVVNLALDASFACVLISWGDSAPAYPEALAIVPVAISRYYEQTKGAAGPIAVIGLGVGGDLALRAACNDKRVTLAGAIGPAINTASICDGLLLLREMSLPHAIAWRRRWKRCAFVQALRADEALASLGDRAAICVSGNDGFFDLPQALLATVRSCGVTVETVERVSHQQLVRELAPQWVRSWLRTLKSEHVADAR